MNIGDAVLREDELTALLVVGIFSVEFVIRRLLYACLLFTQWKYCEELIVYSIVFVRTGGGGRTLYFLISPVIEFSIWKSMSVAHDVIQAVTLTIIAVIRFSHTLLLLI